MLLDPKNIGLESCYVQLSLILAELWRKIYFSLMAAIFCTIASDHFKNSFIKCLDPQNMGLDTLNVAKHQLEIDFRGVHDTPFFLPNYTGRNAH